MNIEDIKHRVFGQGLARRNRFQVEIPGIPEDLLASECNLPALNINTTPHRHYPPIQNVATDIIFEDLVITFYVDSSYNIRKQFQLWIAEIINLQDGSWNFFVEYVRDITITFQDEQDVDKLKVEYINCFPKSIGAIEKSYESQNEIQTFQVVFSYSHYQLL